jgi:hypothetical protein
LIFDALLIKDKFRHIFDRIKVFRCKDYIVSYAINYLSRNLNLNKQDNLNFSRQIENFLNCSIVNFDQRYNNNIAITTVLSLIDIFHVLFLFMPNGILDLIQKRLCLNL